jgi:hypothetical protein
MRAILGCIVMCTSAGAHADSPAPPPWSMPDLAGPDRLGFDLVMAVTRVREAVITRTPTPVGENISVDFRNRTTAFFISTLTAEAHVSRGWSLGADVPYVTSDHPQSAPGLGNISAWARYTRAPSPTRNHYLGAGLVLRLPSAKEQGPYDYVESDPDFASEAFVAEYSHYQHHTAAARAHFDFRAGVRRFVQFQVSLDVGLENLDDTLIVPRICAAGGGMVWRELAVVVEVVAVPIPESGHDLGDHGTDFLGETSVGFRYMGHRFYAGLRFLAFAGDRTGAGGGADVSYLF